jgi:signal transduction histidine kinase
MRNLTQSPVLRYGLAAAIYWLLIGLSTGLRRYWGISFDTTTLIILTMIASAWYLGRGPGLLVALLFEATLDYYAGFPRVAPRFYVIMFNRIVLFGSVVMFASARRHAEDKLRQTGEQLKETLEREQASRAAAESASRLKDDFLATVSHELRTPLNAILGWAATLNRHAVDEETTRQAVQVIERNANAQARLVDDILDFSLIQKGRLRIQPQPVALAAVVREAIETVRLSAAAKAIVIESALDDATVPGDPDRLRQIIWNLLSNAVKFTPVGGRIQVRLAAGTGVELQVEDSGAGIDHEFLPYVFDQFRQGDQSMTRAHGGLGLGLAIVRHLVELHGGTISAHSAGVGKGAAFTVKLPVARREMAAAPNATIPNSATPNSQTSKVPTL